MAGNLIFTLFSRRCRLSHKVYILCIHGVTHPAAIKSLGYKRALSIVTLVAFPLDACFLRGLRGRVSPGPQIGIGGTTPSDMSRLDDPSVVPSSPLDPCPMTSNSHSNAESFQREASASSEEELPQGPWVRICSLGALTSIVLLVIHSILKIPYVIATTDSSVVKILFALVFWPLLREIFILSGGRVAAWTLTTHISIRRRSPAAPRFEVWILGFSTFSRLVGRFVTSSMKSPLLTLFVAFVQSFQEVLFRQTADRRKRLIARYIARKSEAQIFEIFDSGEGRRFHARMILLDMIAE